MNVGDVDQADIAEGVEFQQLVLGQRLLCGQLAPIAKRRRPVKSSCSHAGLKKVSARNHAIGLLLRLYMRMFEWV